MVDTCVGPSELHLKKELSALRKATYFCDPPTCSSCQCPLSSGSLAATHGLNHNDKIRGDITGVSNYCELLDVARLEDGQKNVYMYNWRHHNETKLNEGSRQESPRQSSEYSISNPSNDDSKSDTYLEIPARLYDIGGTHHETIVRKVRKSHRTGTSRKQKHVLMSKLLDLPSCALGVSNPVEQSDNTEYCISDDFKQSTHELAQRSGYLPHSLSPLFCRSEHRNWLHSSKICRSTRVEESSNSCTPASTSSYNRYEAQNPSTVMSGDGTSSFDEDELDEMVFSRYQGCGIRCYWPKRTNDVGCGGWSSPSLSDTLRRKGSTILWRGQKSCKKKRIPASRKQRHHQNSEGLPLLTGSFNRVSSSSDEASEQLSLTNFGELELEALSQLDGRRWSSCKSQEGMQRQRSLSQKHRPRSFDEIVGQTIVVQSLRNAVLRAKIVSAYLFHGPRGTGKTSTARIFSAALNCMSTEDKKPCGFCNECSSFFGGNPFSVIEVVGASRKNMDEVIYLLNNISDASKLSRYRVFIIDECHMLSSNCWSAFTKFLEEPPLGIVFIFITINPDSLPRLVLSRCQKYIFPKIKDVDIACRLRKLSADENFDVELDALDLIASQSHGSLCDAEMMLEQLSLLGKKITTSLVNDLVGVVPEEKLLDLLEIAMSSDTTETVKRSREVMDSGIEPTALMSQLAAIIMDIISGTHQLANSKCGRRVLGTRSLTEAELVRLQKGLKILTDAQKKLVLSTDCSTWFTAALLQLGSAHTLEPPRLSKSSKHNDKFINHNAVHVTQEISLHDGNSIQAIPRVISRNSNPDGCARDEDSTSQLFPENCSVKTSLPNATDVDRMTKVDFGRLTPEELAEIWHKCIEKCHSKTLRQLLCTRGKLLSIMKTEGTLVAFIGFTDDTTKSRAERFLSSITTSVEIVLRNTVHIRIIKVSEYYAEQKSVWESTSSNHQDCRLVNVTSVKDGEHEPPRTSTDFSEGTHQKHYESLAATVPIILEEDGGKENEQELSFKRTPASTNEQGPESNWLQVVEKEACRSVNHSGHERNQVLPTNVANAHNCNRSSITSISKKWEEELNQHIKALKGCKTPFHRSKRTNERLHSNNLEASSTEENHGYDSGPGCNAFLCWSSQKPRRSQVRQRTRVRLQSKTCLSLFGQCGQSHNEKKVPGDDDK